MDRRSELYQAVHQDNGLDTTTDLATCVPADVYKLEGSVEGRSAISTCNRMNA